MIIACRMIMETPSMIDFCNIDFTIMPDLPVCGSLDCIPLRKEHKKDMNRKDLF